jgi:hypothetical protein
MPAPKKFDLMEKLASDPSNRLEGTFTFKPAETKAERDHQLATEAADGRHERRKDLIILIAVLLGLATILGLCLSLAISKESSAEDKKWATAVLASTVTLGMGYLVGKQKPAK